MAITKQTVNETTTSNSSRPVDIKRILRHTPRNILVSIVTSLLERHDLVEAFVCKLPDPTHCIICHETIPDPKAVARKAKKSGKRPSQNPCRVQHRESEWQCEGEGFSEYGCCGGWEQNGVQGYCHEGQHSTDPKDRILWQGLGEELEDCEDLNCALKILDGLVESDDEEEEESFEDEPEEQKSEQQEQLGESRSDLRRRIAVRSLNSRPGAS